VNIDQNQAARVPKNALLATNRNQIIMKRILLPVLASLALIFSAAAQTIQWPVTPERLSYSNFVFSVTTQAANDGTAFHVTIATTTGVIEPDSAALLVLVTGTAAHPAVAAPVPAVTVTLQHTDTQWTADFTASAALTGNPAASFVFVVTDYRVNPDGTRTYLPTDRMYKIRLQDFLPQ